MNIMRVKRITAERSPVWGVARGAVLLKLRRPGDFLRSLLATVLALLLATAPVFAQEPAPQQPTPPSGQKSLPTPQSPARSEEHTSELQSPCNLVCRLLLEKKK